MKTSEEQAEAKRLEREQKLKLYKSATQTVFQKVGPSELAPSPRGPLRIEHRDQELGLRILLPGFYRLLLCDLGKLLNLFGVQVCSSVK